MVGTVVAVAVVVAVVAEGDSTGCPALMVLERVVEGEAVVGRAAVAEAAAMALALRMPCT